MPPTLALVPDPAPVRRAVLDAQWRQHSEEDLARAERWLAVLEEEAARRGLPPAAEAR